MNSNRLCSSCCSDEGGNNVEQAENGHPFRIVVTGPFQSGRSSLVNALIGAVGRELGKDISGTFTELEKIWAEYGVYENVGPVE